MSPLTNLPVDPARMRYATINVLDPAWLAHHFRWSATLGGGSPRGTERLRSHPYHGQLSIEGDYRSHRLEPAREGLRDAIIEFLVREMNGVRVPVDSFAYDHPVTVNGQTVNVAYGSSGQH